MLRDGLERGDRSLYKLFLHCTLIVTSVVPPELPMELSLAITNSLQALISVGIYCTEPYRIPSAGKVDVCCFDKTGTITSDRLVVRGVAGVMPCAPRTNQRKPRRSRRGRASGTAPAPASAPTSEHGAAATTAADTDSNSNSNSAAPAQVLMGGVPLTPITAVPEHTLHVLAGCHSLVQVDGAVAGDPMEQAAMRAVGWTLGGPGVSKPFGTGVTFAPTLGRDRLRVLARFPFDSALKRMATIVCCEHLPRSPMRCVHEVFVASCGL